MEPVWLFRDKICVYDCTMYIVGFQSQLNVDNIWKIRKYAKLSQVVKFFDAVVVSKFLLLRLAFDLIKRNNLEGKFGGYFRTSSYSFRGKDPYIQFLTDYSSFY